MPDAMRLKTIPDVAERLAFYEAAAQTPGVQEIMTRPPHRRKQWMRYLDILTFIAPYAPTILELGCCEGLMTVEIARRARHVVAVDWSPTCLARARARGLDNVEWVEDDVMALTAQWRRQERHFDLVVASDVLEHVEDPLSLMRGLGCISDGMLASSPINEEPNPLAFDYERQRNPLRIGDGSAHIWSFRPDTFRSLFSEIWHEETFDNVTFLVYGRAGDDAELEAQRGAPPAPLGGADGDDVTVVR